ncbi:MAG: asparagine synthase (glutamine-hydrolyzing) [Gemmatimonadaceae bacterium]
MCGIFGAWSRGGEPLDLSAIQRATNELRHRGPDDEGYFFFGPGGSLLTGGADSQPRLSLPNIARLSGSHFNLAFGFRRLSILDLSEGGHQPMRSPDGRFAIEFNGEIYNHDALRTELSHAWTFRSRSDSEVVLAAFATWGPECVRRFNGMWAIAAWDSASELLWLSRDRFGIKPLYLSERDGTVCFASEVKAIRAFDSAAVRPQRDVLAAYIAWNQLPLEARGECSFDGASVVPPGHSAFVRRNQVEIVRHYSIPHRPDRATAAGAISEFGTLLQDSVALRLRADVPVGTCLSGGLDSSAIVAVGAKDRTPGTVHVFSAVYDDGGRHDETPFIDAVVQQTAAVSHRVVPSVDDLAHDLDRLIWHQEQPFGSSSIFAQWCVMRLVRAAGITVLLDGQGADETLGGYLPTVSVAVADRGKRSPIGALRLAAAASQGVGAPLGGTLLRAALWSVSPGLRAAAARVWFRERSSVLRARFAPAAYDRFTASLEASRSVYDNHLRFGMERGLPDLLRFEDRNSMAFSVEARTPFLDVRLVELAFGEAADYRLHEGWTKWVLRRAVEDRLPDDVTWRRGKVGFETPERRWLSIWPGGLPVEPVVDVLEDVVNPGLAAAALASARKGDGGPETTSLAWRLLVAATWLRQWS